MLSHVELSRQQTRNRRKAWESLNLADQSRPSPLATKTTTATRQSSKSIWIQGKVKLSNSWVSCQTMNLPGGNSTRTCSILSPKLRTPRVVRHQSLRMIQDWTLWVIESWRKVALGTSNSLSTNLLYRWTTQRRHCWREIRQSVEFWLVVRRWTLDPASTSPPSTTSYYHSCHRFKLSGLASLTSATTSCTHLSLYQQLPLVGLCRAAIREGTYSFCGQRAALTFLC